MMTDEERRDFILNISARVRNNEDLDEEDLRKAIAVLREGRASSAAPRARKAAAPSNDPLLKNLQDLLD